MRWFSDHLIDGVSVRDISDGVVGFGLAGPKSRDLLELVAHDDVSADVFKFMQCREMDIGLIRAKVGRISVTGELGYEIHCSAAEHVKLRRTLLEAGKEVGAIEWGFNTMGSLRMEKSFGIWSKEFRQEYTPGMTGMDRWIDWSKEFVGKEAALKEYEEGSAPMKLVTLEIDASDADGSEYEPVWQGDDRVGFITSGEYGHTVKKSLAMALVEPEVGAPGTELTAHVVGEERLVKVIEPSPYDPTGSAMRG
jgi:dimethylglycine dehydrogenase